MTTEAQPAPDVQPVTAIDAAVLLTPLTADEIKRLDHAVTVALGSVVLGDLMTIAEDLRTLWPRALVEALELRGQAIANVERQLRHLASDDLADLVPMTRDGLVNKDDLDYAWERAKDFAVCAGHQPGMVGTNGVDDQVELAAAHKNGFESGIGYFRSRINIAAMEWQDVSADGKFITRIKDLETERDGYRSMLADIMADGAYQHNDALLERARSVLKHGVLGPQTATLCVATTTPDAIRKG